MNDSSEHKSRKLQGFLLIAMLLLFGIVFNRKLIESYIYPQPKITSNTSAARRASNSWNKLFVDSSFRLVQDGDLILRTGTDAVSDMFRKANTHDKTYSHAGLVFIENGIPVVYNFMGSAQNPRALMRRDSLNSYITPYSNSGFAVYRFMLSKNEKEQLHDISVKYFKESRKFDPNFNLETDSLLYCTEYIYKALVETTHKEDYFPLTQMADFRFIAVDNLYSRKDMKLICKIGYKQ
ncbi:hypothetical protein F0919_11245 [Taibaiella lutea]|uniref:Permuted papain-like amidase YaeF/Yiix C92 family enzyme n=1 Tax=Taibaiella lutea TaxID=2608001 RepID=A0A5M6CGT8_9BACT|nr:YiiX/YebB-like N1pC/P60 family cysteine hydrolase [Taibaiella lutea]KAA5533122.1 hypothetical protein F0919_11245 [Taibaiella lutea]